MKGKGLNLSIGFTLICSLFLFSACRSSKTSTQGSENFSNNIQVST